MAQVARDLLTDETGQIQIDPDTHDLIWITGYEEIAQRIRATLLIRLGEMVNLAVDTGTDYSHFFGKKFNSNFATTDLITTIKTQVPEVQTVDKINFTKLPNRGLKVDFSATAKLDNIAETVKGVVNFGY